MFKIPGGENADSATPLAVVLMRFNAVSIPEASFEADSVAWAALLAFCASCCNIVTVDKCAGLVATDDGVSGGVGVIGNTTGGVDATAPTAVVRVFGIIADVVREEGVIVVVAVFAVMDAGIVPGCHACAGGGK